MNHFRIVLYKFKKNMLWIAYEKEKQQCLQLLFEGHQ